MIKETISSIIMCFFIVILFLMVMGMSGDTFSINGDTEGVNTDLNKSGSTILMGLTFLLIVGIMIIMIFFGNNLLNLKLRYKEGFTDTEGFVDNEGFTDNEGFMGSGSCTKNLSDEKLFCSTEHKKSLFTNLVSLDRKIDYLKKEFEKIKRKKK